MDFSVHGILQARILEWIAFPSPGDLPDSGITPIFPVSLALQADSLPIELSRKPMYIITNKSLADLNFFLLIIFIFG